jgi:hypothetical protein
MKEYALYHIDKKAIPKEKIDKGNRVSLGSMATTRSMT